VQLLRTYIEMFGVIRDGKGGHNGFESELRRLGITHKNGKPNHPRLRTRRGRFSAGRGRARRRACALAVWPWRAPTGAARAGGTR